MRKLAPAVLAAVVLGVVAYGQQRRADGKIHIGSANTDVVVEGNVYATSPDGGLILSGLDSTTLGGKTVAAAQAQDGGTQTPLCQFGHIALSDGDAGVTFRTAFSSIPSCVCSSPTAGQAACNVSTVSTTAVGVSVASGSGKAHYICCGDL